MSHAIAVHAFLLACFHQVPVAPDGATDVLGPPSVTTPSSGVMIDIEPACAVPATQEQSLASRPSASPAVDTSGQRPATGPTASGSAKSDAAGTGSARARPAVLKRSAASSGEVAPRRRPWYRSSLIALAAVLGLVCLVTYLLRRYVPAVRALGDGVLKLVQRTPLSSKQSIALVRVGQRMVLIGITPDHISSLCVIDDPEELARLMARADKDARRAGQDFEAALSDEADKFERSACEELEATLGRSPLEDGRPRADVATRLGDTKGQLQGMLRKLRETQVD